MKNNLAFPFLICIPLDSFSYITNLAKAMNTVLNRYEECMGILVFFNFNVNPFNFSPFRMLLAMGLL